METNSTELRELQSESDHDQIIDQVISLEREYSHEPAVDGHLGSIIDPSPDPLAAQQQHPRPQHLHHQHHHQPQQPHHQQPQPPPPPPTPPPPPPLDALVMQDSSQLSTSSEDLLNILLELDRGPPNSMGLDQDEKVGIENIRKQLMSCEMQSDQQNPATMSPILDSVPCTPQPQHHNVHQHMEQHSPRQRPLISQSATVIPQHQLPASSSASISQQPHQQQHHHHHRLSVDQSILHGSYSNVCASVNSIPTSSSGQQYASQQQQHHNTLTQAIVSESPSPSWQPPQISPYSPQNIHNDNRNSQMQTQHHLTSIQPQSQPLQPLNHQQQQQQHQSTTSPLMQQLHQISQGSMSQSISPPVTNEPSPVVKKNPLLNAQLVNSRSPSITPTRFINDQSTNLLNQNPILNAKLSQSPYVANNSSSPVNPTISPQPRFIQHQQQQQHQPSNFNHNVTHQQTQNAHQMLYRPGDQQQTTHQIFRANTIPSQYVNSGQGSPMNIASDSNVGFSRQVKQEIRRKVQQQHQTTSLLKKLLSDNNK